MNEPAAGRVLSVRSIVAAGVLLVAIAAAVAWVLLHLFGGGTPQDAARLDAVRTTATIVLGTGGAVALLLAARRQRSTEQTLVHQMEVARGVERDALERRTAESFTRASDQLGSSSAAVRLAGAYALEQIGREDAGRRQMIVDVLCAYLRVPPSADTSDPQEDVVREVVTDRVVTHLKKDSADFWPGISVNLSNTTLGHLLLSDTEFVVADFHGTTFRDRVTCSRSVARIVNFEDCTFEGGAQFGGLRVASMAMFDRAVFTGFTDFSDARFPWYVSFADAEFADRHSFTGATISSEESDLFGVTMPDGWRFEPGPDPTEHRVVPESGAGLTPG
ncbi:MULTISPECIES: pentapeptide repeat-containing protein [Pseudonocardia]|uniref:Pentapeptide repeats (8 copies) n=2 Tax=Pseudonocardia TaxID=1847 RepID=A0A1Y2MJ55_PSEAH|nr:MULTISPECIES: pentapeptide repeat-containing protein [Pseudonocardia]OSY35280.1 hypothetical protein BG845_06146 [Pseudonocardia autotrophica]TDN73281.1 hypothetical protein C8E95_2372 [Pseudonocardia autotrophica]BBG04017.1 hypothetical protein Pdca_52260 [Pseudonocardia autotrophica]GEC27731.1 hypothetical protein PSA01_47600 [Pseudonocardia saturnea]